MVVRKRNEGELGSAMRSLGYWVYKGRDRGFVTCPICHHPLMQCPYCKGSLLLNKAMTMPDFVVARNWFYVEAKQGGDSWDIKDFTPTQITVMDENTRKGGEGYLFLELGLGRAPDGRSAWLVPWKPWTMIMDKMLSEGTHSLRFEQTARSRMPLAKDVLRGFELEWESGGWTIPKSHVFWQAGKTR